MNRSSNFKYAAAALAVSLAFGSAPAHASGAAAVVAAVQALGSQMVNAVMNSFASGFLKPLLMSSTAQIQGEIAKGTQAQIQSDMAIAQYEANNRMREQAAEIAEKSQPAYATCNVINGAADLKNASTSVSRKTGQEAAFMARVVTNYGGDAQRAKQLREASINNYASEDDARRYGVKKSEKLPAADVDASYLFGAKDGSLTYAQGQDEAVTLMIDRLTTMGAPTPLANQKDENSRAGTVYRENQKRYASMMSIAQDALLSVKNNYTPVVNGRSMMDTLSDMINTRFSKENIIANATTMQPVVILRDIAIMDSIRLSMDYTALRHQEKMIALLATQQVLLANEEARRINAMKQEVIQNASR